MKKITIAIIVMAAALSLRAQPISEDDRYCSMMYFSGYADTLAHRPIDIKIKNAATVGEATGTYTNYRQGREDALAGRTERIARVVDISRTVEGRQLRTIIMCVVLPYERKSGDPAATRAAAMQARLCRDLGLTNARLLVEEMAGY